MTQSTVIAALRRDEKGHLLPQSTQERQNSLRDRFWAKVQTSDDCWIWTGFKDKLGYGRLMWHDESGRYQPLLAHRVAYELIIGPIPTGKVLDHIECDNPPCVNPGHLIATTQWGNCERTNGACAVNARKTHCVQGHPLVEGNLYRCNGKGRICRTCKLAVQKKRRILGKLSTKNCQNQSTSG
jgi:hypothetical protein